MCSLQFLDLNLNPDRNINPNLTLSQIAHCILQIVQTHKLHAPSSYVKPIPTISSFFEQPVYHARHT